MVQFGRRTSAPVAHDAVAEASADVAAVTDVVEALADAPTTADASPGLSRSSGSASAGPAPPTGGSTPPTARCTSSRSPGTPAPSSAESPSRPPSGRASASPAAPGRLATSSSSPTSASWVAACARRLPSVGVRSGICFPLLEDGEVAGTMDFFATEILTPSPQRLDALRAIGKRVSQAIERVGAAARQAKAAEDTRTVSELLREITSATNRAEAMSRALDPMRHGFDWTYGSYWAVDRTDRAALRHRVGHGGTGVPRGHPRRVVPGGRGPVRPGVEGPRPRLRRGSGRDDRVRPRPGRAPRRGEVRRVPADRGQRPGGRHDGLLRLPHAQPPVGDQRRQPRQAAHRRGRPRGGRARRVQRRHRQGRQDHPRHRRPDQPARARRDHRGGACRRGGPRVRRRRP